MQVKTLNNSQEIQDSIQLLEEFNNGWSSEDSEKQASEMIELGYKFGIVTKENEIIGVVICKIREKLFYGKILQVDEFFINRGHRGVGVGKMLISWLKWQSLENDCNHISCVIASHRKESQKILSREGFNIEGLYFIK